MSSMNRHNHGRIALALTMSLSLIHCSYDVVFSPSDSGTRAGAAGQSNKSSLGDNHAGGAIIAHASAGAPTTAYAAAGAVATAWPMPAGSWQWQLTGPIDTTPVADTFVVDLTEATDDALSTLRSQSRKVICNFSAGTSEAWRADAASLPPEVRGNALPARSDETWLDIRSTIVRSAMTKRLDLAEVRGCHGVLPDSIDGYAAVTGFPITEADALDYLYHLSQAAHARHLAIGLSNASELVGSAAPWFDFEVEVSCLEYDECDKYRPFLVAGKPVFHAELVNDAARGAEQLDSICSDPRRSGFSSILKTPQLDAWRLTCD